MKMYRIIEVKNGWVAMPWSQEGYAIMNYQETFVFSTIQELADWLVSVNK